MIFICVPTPYENGFDRSYLEDAFSHFKNTVGKIVVIKSTSLPGTADYFQAQYPNLKVLFNPEFLTEKTAAYDAAHPNRNIIGIPSKMAIKFITAERIKPLLMPNGFDSGSLNILA